MAFRGGDIRVRKTAQGYLAVLRVSGPDGVGYTFTSGCGYDEAAALSLVASGDEALETGFSFAGIARSIGKAASAVARSRVFRTMTDAAAAIPGPVGDVGRMAKQAARAIQGMRNGDAAAAAAWRASAAVAREAPNSARAVAMRLAMQAEGRPAMGRAAPPPPPPPPAPPPPPPAPGDAPSDNARPGQVPVESAAQSESWPFAPGELEALMAAGGEIADIGEGI